MTVNFKHHLLKVERKRKALETAREEFEEAIREAYEARDNKNTVSAIAYRAQLSRQRIHQIVR